jgi:hypothetical protein
MFDGLVQRLGLVYRALSVGMCRRLACEFCAHHKPILVESISSRQSRPGEWVVSEDASLSALLLVVVLLRPGLEVLQVDQVDRI